ncbi:unnamed protein product [Ectocarpus fasciculatus]
MSDEEAWEPLTMVDYLMLGIVGTFQAFALGVCVHLFVWRKWPPYVTKNVEIVIIMTLAGFAWTFAGALENGLIRRSEGDILAKCYLERFLAWSTLSIHVSAFGIRIYQMWKILVKHDDNMWPAKYQIMLLSSPSLVPPLVALLVPGAHVFDETVNSCNTTSTSRTVVLAMNAFGFCIICFLWFVCVRQLRRVRKQFNEYKEMTRTLLCLTLISFSYALVVVSFLDNSHHVLARRLAIVFRWERSPGGDVHLVSLHLGQEKLTERPLMKKWDGDEEYLWSYTKGFSELPSPAQLKASLAEQLSVEQLRIEFRGYMQSKVAQELVDFYLDSLDREEIHGFFGRQAVTMRIVARYIREGAPEQVNLSGACRQAILSTDVTAHDIFDRARAEVLALMEGTFKAEFVETEGFRRIADASELEDRENRLLRAGGVLPAETLPAP